ncbi:MAG: hypothetical protein ACF8OB_16800 [Phycisphaeraceae bacterium JB051]
MFRYLLIAAMVVGVGWTQLDAQEISLVSLTDHKTILLGNADQAQPTEIKLGSPVAADQLIGLAVGDVLPQYDGKELVVLRSDRHLEFYPFPDSKTTILKRHGYCPVANPAKRTAVAIALAEGQLLLLCERDDSGWQYAETYALDTVTLSQAIKRSGFISLKSPDSPHQPLLRLDSAPTISWAGVQGMVLLTTASDTFLELYKVNKTAGQRIGHGFKQAGKTSPIAARWQNQHVVALYQDGSLVEFDQALPAPRIVKVTPTQHIGVVDFVTIGQ